MPNKDSFTFSDKLKKSKSLPLSKRIPSRMGPDNKAKRTLIQRAQRDLPFIIVAAAALLLLPVLSRDNGAGSTYPVMPEWDDNNVYAENGGTVQGTEQPVISPGTFQDPLSWINRPGEDRNAALTPEVIEHQGEDVLAPTTRSERSVDKYGTEAKRGVVSSVTRKATEKGSLRNSSAIAIRGSGGFGKSYSIYTPTKGEASSRLREGVRPVALQPMESAGKSGRSLTGEGLAAEASRSLGAMNRGPAKQALYNAQLRDTDGKSLGEIGSGPKIVGGARAGTGGSPSNKNNYQIPSPWWMDMEKTKYMKEWELWHYNFQKAIAEPLAKGMGNIFSCLLFGSKGGETDKFLGQLPGDTDYDCKGPDGKDISGVGSWGDFRDGFGKQTSGTGDNKEEKSGGEAAWEAWITKCRAAGGDWKASDGSPKAWWDVRFRCLGLKVKPFMGKNLTVDCSGINDDPIKFHSWISRNDDKVKKRSEEMLIHYVVAGTRPAVGGYGQDKYRNADNKSIKNQRVIYVAKGGILDGVSFKKDVLEPLQKACPSQEIVVTKVGAIKTSERALAPLSYSMVDENRKGLCAGKEIRSIFPTLNGKKKLRKTIALSQGESKDLAELKVVFANSELDEYKAALSGASSVDIKECKVYQTDAVIAPVYVETATDMNRGSTSTAKGNLDCANVNFRAALQTGKYARFVAEISNPDKYVYAVHIENVDMNPAHPTIKNIVDCSKKDYSQEISRETGRAKFSYEFPAGRAVSSETGIVNSEEGRGEIMWLTSNEAPSEAGLKKKAISSAGAPLDSLGIEDIFPQGHYKAQSCYFRWCSDSSCTEPANAYRKGYCTDNGKVVKAVSFNGGDTWLSTGVTAGADATSSGICQDVCYEHGVVYTYTKYIAEEGGKSTISRGEAVGDLTYMVYTEPALKDMIKACQDIGAKSTNDICSENNKLYPYVKFEEKGISPLLLKTSKTPYTEETLPSLGKTLNEMLSSSAACSQVCKKTTVIGPKDPNKPATSEETVVLKSDFQKEIIAYKDLAKSSTPNVALAASLIGYCGEDDKTDEEDKSDAQTKAGEDEAADVKEYCSGYGTYFYESAAGTDGSFVILNEADKEKGTLKKLIEEDKDNIKPCQTACKNKKGEIYLADESGKATNTFCLFNMLTSNIEMPEEVKSKGVNIQIIYQISKQFTPPSGVVDCVEEAPAAQAEPAAPETKSQQGEGKTGCKDGDALYKYISVAGYNISTGELLEPANDASGNDTNSSIGDCQNARVCIDQEGNLRLGLSTTATIIAPKGSAEVSQLGKAQIAGCLEVAGDKMTAEIKAQKPACGKDKCRLNGFPYQSVLYNGLAIKVKTLPASLDKCEGDVPDCAIVCFDQNNMLRKGVFTDGEAVGPLGGLGSFQEGAIMPCVKKPDIAANCDMEFVGEFKTASFMKLTPAKASGSSKQVADVNELVRRLKDCLRGGGFANINMAVGGHTDRQGETKAAWDRLITAAANKNKMTKEEYMKSGKYATDVGSLKAWTAVREGQNIQLSADRALYLVQSVTASLADEGITSKDIGVTFNDDSYSLSKRFSNTPSDEKSRDIKAELGSYMGGGKPFVFDITAYGSEQCSSYDKTSGSSQACRKVVLKVSPENQQAVITAINNFGNSGGCYNNPNSEVCRNINMYTGANRT